jgi:hypothetical protein
MKIEDGEIQCDCGFYILKRQEGSGLRVFRARVALLSDDGYMVVKCPNKYCKRFDKGFPIKVLMGTE